MRILLIIKYAFYNRSKDTEVAIFYVCKTYSSHVLGLIIEHSVKIYRHLGHMSRFKGSDETKKKNSRDYPAD